MQVSVTPASLAEKPVLANLLQLYHYDFTEFIPDLELGEDGLYPYRYLDAYWDPEPGEQRYPLLIRCEGDLVGFALVRFVNETYVMAEFFVLRPYRRLGAGTQAATAVFRMFSGKWIVHQVPGNLPAQGFWRKVVGDVTGGEFEDDVDEDGVTQRFDLTPDPKG